MYFIKKYTLQTATTPKFVIAIIYLALVFFLLGAGLVITKTPFEQSCEISKK